MPREGIRHILIRGTNWIGDAVMTLPAVSSIRDTYPGATLSVLAKPWVAEVYRLSPDIDEVIPFESPGVHGGITGKLRLAGEMRGRFEAAILLQNAIEAAIIALLAGIPIRAGYDSDGRRLLLSHAVRRTAAIRKVHQVSYYLEMVQALGCVSARPVPVSPLLVPGPEYGRIADDLFTKYGISGSHLLIGVAPGATYGPAKKWFPERFADVATRIVNTFPARVILFGSRGDIDSTRAVEKSSGKSLINLAGKTTLKEAIALIARCDLFISNDSGLMHVAGALGIPTIAVFGSTNAATTSPVGEKSVVIRHRVACSPCLKKKCPTDFLCMDLVTVEEVYAAASELLTGKELHETRPVKNGPVAAQISLSPRIL